MINKLLQLLVSTPTTIIATIIATIIGVVILVSLFALLFRNTITLYLKKKYDLFDDNDIVDFVDNSFDTKASKFTIKHKLYTYKSTK